MRFQHILFTVSLLAVGCEKDPKPVGTTPPVDTGSGQDTDIQVDTADTDTDETQDTGSSDDTGDTQDTSDTEDTGSVEDTADTIDTGIIDTADTDTGSIGPGPNAVADFSLPDINPASPSVGQNISPRDYLQQISGWYFIKST